MCRLALNVCVCAADVCVWRMCMCVCVVLMCVWLMCMCVCLCVYSGRPSKRAHMEDSFSSDGSFGSEYDESSDDERVVIGRTTSKRRQALEAAKVHATRHTCSHNQTRASVHNRTRLHTHNHTRLHTHNYIRTHTTRHALTQPDTFSHNQTRAGMCPHS